MLSREQRLGKMDLIHSYQRDAESHQVRAGIDKSGAFIVEQRDRGQLTEFVFGKHHHKRSLCVRPDSIELLMACLQVEDPLLLAQEVSYRYPGGEVISEIEDVLIDNKIPYTVHGAQ